MDKIICPICHTEARVCTEYTLSGRKLTRIGCDTEKCPNNIRKSPTHTSLPETLRKWEARKWDGHYHRKPKETTPIDTKTLAIPFAD